MAFLLFFGSSFLSASKNLSVKLFSLPLQFFSGTGQYFASIVAGKVDGGFGPAIVFIISSIIAFSTGTSWGTFAIMIPIALQMSVAIDANIFAAVGAVISGAIMGDHCSPISDTTILSSMASASDHIDHVETQLPYALLNGLITTVLFLVVGFWG